MAKTLKEQLAKIEKKYISQIIDEEVLKLESYIKDNINEYLSSYSPVSYSRTGAWLDSMYVTKSKIVGNTITVSIKFNDTFANHPSVMGEKYEFGYVPMLMETGWDIRNKVGKSIPNFTHYKATRYISRAVEKFNQDNKYGIKVSVYFKGEQYIYN